MPARIRYFFKSLVDTRLQYAGPGSVGLDEAAVEHSGATLAASRSDQQGGGGQDHQDDDHLQPFSVVFHRIGSFTMNIVRNAIRLELYGGP